MDRFLGEYFSFLFFAGHLKTQHYLYYIQYILKKKRMLVLSTQLRSKGAFILKTTLFWVSHWPRTPNMHVNDPIRVLRSKFRGKGFSEKVVVLLLAAHSTGTTCMVLHGHEALQVYSPAQLRPHDRPLLPSNPPKAEGSTNRDVHDEIWWTCNSFGQGTTCIEFD